MKISLKSQNNSNILGSNFKSIDIYNENIHAADHATEMYKKCLSFAHDDNPLYNNFKYAPSLFHTGLDHLEIKMIQKKISKRSSRFGNFGKFGNFGIEKKPQQVIFSTLTRIYLKKNINLLFPIQDFLFECNKHANKSTGSRSREYLEILLCIKKLKMFYGYIPLKQLHRILSQASIMPGYFSKNFFSLIEKRLDVVLYRSGFAKTIVAARQACRHSKIYVNSKICRLPSILLNPGDIISYTPKKTPYTLHNRVELINENDKIQKTHLQNVFCFDEIKPTSFYSSGSKLNYSLSLLLLFCGKCVSNSIILDSKNKQGLQIKQSTKKCIESNSNYNSTMSTMKILETRQDTTLDKNISYIDTTGFFSLNLSKINKNKCFDYSSFIQTIKHTGKSYVKEKKIGLEGLEINDVSFSKTKQNNYLFPSLENLVFLSNRIESYSTVLALTFQKKISILKTVHINSLYTKTTQNRKKQIDNILYWKGSKIGIDLEKINKPIHLEISKITNTIIFLYSPQRIYLPFHLDIDILRKSMKN